MKEFLGFIRLTVNNKDIKDNNFKDNKILKNDKRYGGVCSSALLCSQYDNTAGKIFQGVFAKNNIFLRDRRPDR